MNTPPGDRLRIADLAKRGVLKRSISAQALTRLAQAAKVLKPVAIEAYLDTDEQGRRWLRGSACGAISQSCQRCLEPVSSELAVTFDLWLVDEQKLPQLRQREAAMLASADVRLVTDGQVELAALIEDELLLELDMQPCKLANCPNMPSMTYSSLSGPVEDTEQQAAEEPRADTQRPFADLKQRLEEQQGNKSK